MCGESNKKRPTIKIFGKGCGSCFWTERFVREVVAQSGVEVDIEKISKKSEMALHGITLTPAVVVGDRVVHAGGIPTKEEVRRWVMELEVAT